MAQLVHLFLLFASVLAEEKLLFPKLPYEEKVKNMCPIQQTCIGEPQPQNCTEAICIRDLRNGFSLSATSCCTSGFKIKCCAKLSSAIKWKPKKLATLLKKMDKKKECQNEENYCICDVIGHNLGRGIAGICCGDADCNCCATRVKRAKDKRVDTCKNNEIRVEIIWPDHVTKSCEHAEKEWYWVATATDDQHERRTNNSESGFPSSSAFLMMFMEVLILAPIF
ncbi:hypothetical protein niasHS_001989 [Heterodera schachtii]|uniref:Uncharacterized protein n=1 Tax=Heterodera schachtii TaxID=97005 RepID=A0ABD2K607_HETSC